MKQSDFREMIYLQYYAHFFSFEYGFSSVCVSWCHYTGNRVSFHIYIFTSFRGVKRVMEVVKGWIFVWAYFLGTELFDCHFYNLDIFLALASEAADKAAFAILFCSVSVIPVIWPTCRELLAKDFMGGIGGGGGAGVIPLEDDFGLLDFEWSVKTLDSMVSRLPIRILVGANLGGFKGFVTLVLLFCLVTGFWACIISSVSAIELSPSEMEDDGDVVSSDVVVVLWCRWILFFSCIKFKCRLRKSDQHDVGGFGLYG